MRARSSLKLVLAALILGLVGPRTTSAESAQSIVATMQAKQAAREKGLGSYIVEQFTAGKKQLLYFEKDYQSGQFRMIPQSEIVTDKAMEKGWTPNHTKATMLGMTYGTEELRKAFKSELGLSNEDPLNTSMKAGVLGMLKMSAGLPTTAQYINQKEKDKAAEKQEVLDIKEFGEKAELVGTDTLHGRDAYVLKVDDINRTQTVDGGKFTVQSASMWIDKSKYVPLRIWFEGVAKSDGKSQTMTIVKDSYNYKNEGPLYLPHTEIMGIRGLMNAQQKAEMKEAKEKLAEIEDQLQGPQKEMILKMMAPQIKMLENLAEGKGIAVTTQVKKVTVPASRKSYMMALMGGDPSIEDVPLPN